MQYRFSVTLVCSQNQGVRSGKVLAVRFKATTPLQLMVIWVGNIHLCSSSARGPTKHSLPQGPTRSRLSSSDAEGLAPAVQHEEAGASVPGWTSPWTLGTE